MNKMDQHIEGALLQKAIDQTGVGVVLSNPRLQDNPVIYINKGFEELTGYKANEVIGRNCRFLQGEQTKQEGVQKIRDAIREQSSCEVEILNYKKNGEPFWNELHLTPLFDEQGELEYFIGIQKDITKRKQAEEARILYEKVIQNTMQGVMITDHNANIVLVNEAFTKITGYSFQEAIDKNPKMLSSGKQTLHFYQQLWQDVQIKGQWEGELWNKRKNGEIYPEFLNISEVRNKQNQVTNYVAIFTDITESKKRENQLAKMSVRDALTGIENRRGFDRYLQDKWGMLAEIGEPISLILIDIDYFKQFNDHYGHLEGDVTLIKVAQQIASSIDHETALAARYGGEEFAVVLPQYNLEVASELAQQICLSIEQAAIVHKHSPVKEVISVSCGVASIIPTKDTDVNTLIDFADQALYAAKEQGRNRVVIYEPLLK